MDKWTKEELKIYYDFHMKYGDKKNGRCIDCDKTCDLDCVYADPPGEE